MQNYFLPLLALGALISIIGGAIYLEDLSHVFYYLFNYDFNSLRFVDRLTVYTYAESFIWTCLVSYLVTFKLRKRESPWTYPILILCTVIMSLAIANAWIMKFYGNFDLEKFITLSIILGIALTYLMLTYDYALSTPFEANEFMKSIVLLTFGVIIYSIAVSIASPIVRIHGYPDYALVLVKNWVYVFVLFAVVKLIKGMRS
ncbi:hypothetical protein [Psittacicella hinzii]|uniref:Uncharacterized protein n=1 Tax=Psittacicella hinzii TaxID=2028575 RepID=A0A3A1YS07_9GAMM|nr:hypothetical protein [Psittacicella hinzii]RIY38807.1 hypothetical protein CKF58_03250 [Psittacicella hinzii]